MDKSREVLLSCSFVAQCIFVVLILGISWFKRFPYPDDAYTRIDSHLFFGTFLVVGLVGALLEMGHKRIQSHFLSGAGNVFEVLIFPSALSAAIALLFSIPMAKWSLPGALLSYFAMIILLIGLVPLVYVHIKRAESLVQRIGLVILFDVAFQISMLQLVVLSPDKISQPGVLELISDLGFVLLIGRLMHWWNYKFPDLLKLRVNPNVQVMILTGMFLLWFMVVGISAFSTAESWSQFSSQWSFKLQEVPMVMIIATIAGCFVEEWEFRYAVLWQLIRHYRNAKNPVIKPVIISSLLFGFVHSFNLTNKQSLEATLLQIGMAFTVGVFLAAVYLYTGRFWIAVLMHSLTDLFSGVLTAGASFTETTPNLYIIELTLVIALVLLLVAFYLMFKKLDIIKTTFKEVISYPSPK